MDQPADLLLTLLLALLTVGLGAVFYRWNMDRLQVKQVQRDVYQRLMRDRGQILSNTPGSSQDAYVALNEAYAAFSSSSMVISALGKLHEQWTDSDRLEPNLLTVLKAMAQACGPKMDHLNDDYFLEPFGPPAAQGRNGLHIASPTMRHEAKPPDPDQHRTGTDS